MLRRQLVHHLVFSSSALSVSILASDGAFLDGGKEERECESGIEPHNRGPRTTIGGAIVCSPVLRQPASDDLPCYSKSMAFGFVCPDAGVVGGGGEMEGCGTETGGRRTLRGHSIGSQST